VADELLQRFSSADLAAFSLHIASKRVTDEATVVARRCAKIAIGRLPRDSGSNACNAPAIVTYPAQPSLPTSAPSAKRRVVVEVEVTLETNGLVRNAHVHNSSGRADIDEAALVAATHSTYWPKFVRCHPVESRYLFKAVFDPNRE
jgi:TonB family protein